ncbi:MAG: DNA-binding protein [Thermoplasmata archaeon]
MEEDKELEELRKKKLAQMMSQQQGSEAQEEEKRERAQRAEILRAILTPEARERLTNVRLVKPELVENVENQLIYLAQSGRLNHMITDGELKSLLLKLTEKSRDIKIERR